MSRFNLFTAQLHRSPILSINLPPPPQRQLLSHPFADLSASRSHLNVLAIILPIIRDYLLCDFCLSFSSLTSFLFFKKKGDVVFCASSTAVSIGWCLATARPIVSSSYFPHGHSLRESRP